jgi:hypothetical protein
VQAPATHPLVRQGNRRLQDKAVHRQQEQDPDRLSIRRRLRLLLLLLPRRSYRQNPRDLRKRQMCNTRVSSTCALSGARPSIAY